MEGFGRRAVRAVARRTGQEERLRRLRRALAPYPDRRNRRDDAALAALLAGLLRRDSDCVDVGAHVGAILEHIVRLAPEGRHLAFEPLPDLHADLAAAFPQVDVRRLALSNRSGRGSLLRRAEAAVSSLEYVPPGADPERWRGPILDGAERTPVEVARLDDILPAGFAPAFIKIDVEGTEYDVLEGAIETLREHRPVVAFEHGVGARHYGHEPGEIHELLTERAGLRIFDIDGGGPYDRAALRDEVLSLRRWFFFARPWD